MTVEQRVEINKRKNWIDKLQHIRRQSVRHLKDLAIYYSYNYLDIEQKKEKIFVMNTKYQIITQSAGYIGYGYFPEDADGSPVADSAGDNVNKIKFYGNILKHFPCITLVNKNIRIPINVPGYITNKFKLKLNGFYYADVVSRYYPAHKSFACFCHDISDIVIYRQEIKEIKNGRRNTRDNKSGKRNNAE